MRVVLQKELLTTWYYHHMAACLILNYSLRQSLSPFPQFNNAKWIGKLRMMTGAAYFFIEWHGSISIKKYTFCNFYLRRTRGIDNLGLLSLYPQTPGFMGWLRFYVCYTQERLKGRHVKSHLSLILVENEPILNYFLC